MSNLYLVAEDVASWPDDERPSQLINFDDYLANHPIRGARRTRIINLCDTDLYLSRGYYCSLLAEARGHRVIPSVNTLNDLRGQQIARMPTGDALSRLDKQCPGQKAGQDWMVSIYFGYTDDSVLTSLARRLFELFPCPILDLQLQWNGSWRISALSLGQFSDLSQAQRREFAQRLDAYAHGLWRKPRQQKQRRWTMAILINDEEAMPPSDAGALKRMLRAAGKVGIEAEFIQPTDYARLAEFDALFIRETTEIDHHTYRFARRAELEGLVVIDDPTSILRCCNKVFLQDAFSYNRVPTPRTRIVSRADEATLDELETRLGYPIVLKIPNSAFSVGVHKTRDRRELADRLRQLLEKSALVIAQEFLYTEFDWRIGVLNNRPLYACRYYMAKGHWQIYQHNDGDVNSGASETLPTFEVPKPVLDAAMRAARVVGNGLYGIDLKQQGNKVYVIEVNDNPSLEHGVEDVWLGDELYMQIMSEFARRLEKRGL